MPEHMIEYDPYQDDVLRAKLQELTREFGMRAIVDCICDIDNEIWASRMAPAQHLIEPNGPFRVQFDKATDELRD